MPLSIEAAGMLHDAIACVAGLLGQDEPVYEVIDEGNGQMYVTFALTFDVRDLERFAESIAVQPVGATEAIREAVGDGSEFGWRIDGEGV